MEASKVTVDPELRSSDLSNEAKRELRKQRVVDFIKSKPNGSVILQSEFVPVIGTVESGVSKFLNELEKEGIIKRERVAPLKIAFYVTDPGNIKTRPLHEAEQQTVTPEASGNVADLALRFFWETKSDSLHEFVAWVEQHRH